MTLAIVRTLMGMEVSNGRNNIRYAQIRVRYFTHFIVPRGLAPLRTKLSPPLGNNQWRRSALKN